MSQTELKPIVIQEGPGRSDLTFTDLSTLNDDLAGVLAESPLDKEAYDKLVAVGVSPENALKILCISLLVWKKDVLRSTGQNGMQILALAPAAETPAPAAKTPALAAETPVPTTPDHITPSEPWPRQ